MPETPVNLTWHKALDPDELPEGRVKTVTLGVETVCVTRHQGKYGALCNKCPHQGGPLGEGSIENGYLRCPWHGWDYDPLTGRPPGGFDDAVKTYPIEERTDGVYIGIEQEPAHERDASDVIVETLCNWGLTWCFGMVGHSNLYVADALRRMEEAGRLRYIGIRHEGAASFACSAYGKLTGKPAACLAIAGPGATNLLTGLWDAHVDRAPAIALTGQVSSQVMGRHNFQELPLDQAFGGVAFYTQSVLPASPHAELASQTYKHAVVQRGPTHLIFPDDAAGTKVDGDTPAETPDGRTGDPEVTPSPSAIQQALELLKPAKRPAIIVGHGARFHMTAVRKLAEHLRCPVLTTFKGKGLIPDQGEPADGFHPLGAGVLGRSGTPIASWFMNEADVLLVLGASFSNHTGITPKKPTVQVDYDPMTLAKFHAVDVPVLGGLGPTLSSLQEGLAQHNSIDHASEIAERWKLWRDEKASRRQDDRGQGVNSASVFEALSRFAPADAIMPVDVGNNTYSFGRYFECRNQAVLMSGYLGSIGFALPAALGAWAATQEHGTPWHGRKVVSVSGDGGFGQYAMEFTTAVAHRMNLTHVLIRNDNLGKITKEQRAGNWPVWHTELHNPGFADFATSCGGLGVTVESKDQLDAALTDALAHDGPSLVEVVADLELV
ncbi:MAG: thiamine pyrophosphate-dependent enzyme [Planctomycetota bacterium]